MSAVIKIVKISHHTVEQSINVSGLGQLTLGLAMVAQGAQELGYATEREKELSDCDNELVQVKLLIKTLDGKSIGVNETEDGLEFVLQDLNCALTLESLRKIKQKYAKNAIIYEMKAKGYEKVKEERLPNGKIRIVVEKWE